MTILLALALVTQVSAEAPLAPAPAIASLPGDVRRFITRYGRCQAWIGANRPAGPSSGSRECRGIDVRGAKLRRRFARDAGVTTALNAYPPLNP